MERGEEDDFVQGNRGGVSGTWEEGGRGLLQGADTGDGQRQANIIRHS